jgi:hypothetical protein
MSNVLWCVMNGRAVAPPAMGCSIGVSTSTKPWSHRRWRMRWTHDVAAHLQQLALRSLAHRSTSRWR